MAFGRRGRERAAARRGTPADLLVIGLGNPGSEYDRTRHNVGFEVVDLLAERHDATLRGGRENAIHGEVHIDGRRVALAKPVTYMNESGRAAGALTRRYGIETPQSIVVVHDELDLPIGRLKIKVGGGLAGHNGLRSLQAHLHTTDFARVRIGVGKPPSAAAGRDHVLRRPSKAERAELDVVVVEAADAVELLAVEGPDAAMARYNRNPDQ